MQGSAGNSSNNGKEKNLAHDARLHHVIKPSRARRLVKHSH